MAQSKSVMRRTQIQVWIAVDILQGVSFADCMAYEITGKVKKIFDKQEFPSGFYKQEFVVTTEDRFPQDIKLDCLKEKGEILNGVKEGDQVTVHFDIRGREWNERYFVDLAAWKIESGEGSDQSSPAKTEQAVPAEDPADYGIDDEDIPF
jgi:single-strand DNA-binding protein